jgi:SAM-dependent methyltransferase
MTTAPQTWHYGLVAQWWAEFNTEGPEIAYFQQCIERYGQPALDVACGTGRLLLPYLRAGLDVDGCDISTDMIALCRTRAEGERLTPRLYAQAMHELALPRTYKTIFICGGFGLGGSRQHDIAALRRLYHHLDPGGVLVFDHHLPYKIAGVWQYWTPEKRRQLPQAWSSSGQRKHTTNGDEYELKMRLADVDPLEQIETLQIRVALSRDGKLVAEEENSLRVCAYFKQELLLMLAQAGFRDVTVHGAYTETEATADDGVLVFTAKKEN